MASAALYCGLPGRPLSWTRLREAHVLVKQQIRSCSSVDRSRLADPTPAVTLARENAGSSVSDGNEWKVLAKDLLRKVNKQADFSLEDKYIPLKRSKSKSDATKVHHFVDFRRVKVLGGNGGDGCISLLSVYKKERAGPDGGDGGNGGHVIFKAVKRRKSLEHVNSYIRADDGDAGRNKDCHGKSAENKLIEVPVGTIFKREGVVVANLDKEESLFIGARGGAGGKGNAFFTTDVDQAPRVAEYGGKGEYFEFEAELQTMADVGLIGFPNAGKSTLLRAISRARPKVASYPFTTLNPHVGMIHYADHHQLAVADIPGLIEGAHRNHGLGITFLRHIERCRCLLYVLDVSEPEPWEQLRVLKYELEQYQEGLSNRPHAVVANKIDLPESQENVKKLAQHTDLPLVPVSAKMGQQLIPLLSLLRLLVDYAAQRDLMQSEV
ncbi:mitochondrial ribosome-associated GTPase 2-like [Penaeus japonicus]|uniref:mitochondrial ribosome-associated GTPase 2-like n=1 Tax=Penaeus japonicus TaxID=27405 RepID=UPI001C70F9EC|nr:mitochondrial ribosome-associated GTPase 2-like [Penaeus japonicus]XP_042873357.1 mitochondrial ribosome-associated GTPase 2-like [Penaeus japonicus]XP_042873358.1 mitochondrial ribosome-associated GTPase 2-like [Penaeus japonicus]XP_042873359.1 mitochondrial ribosome-associated GTPase 2-like [Penaeus japonicus]